MYYISQHQYQCYLNNLFGVVSVAHLVATMSDVVLGSVVEVASWNPKICSIYQYGLFTIYLSAFVSLVNLYQFMILCSLKALLFFLICFFYLILYVPSTIFQLNRDGSSWVEPVLQSQVKHSTTEPLRSLCCLRNYISLTSHIYLISLVSLTGFLRLSFANRIDAMH